MRPPVQGRPETGPQISHITQHEDKLITDKELVQFLSKLLPRLHYYDNPSFESQVGAYFKNKEATRSYLGFSVATGPSALSGTGVFVESGLVKAGTVVGKSAPTTPHERAWIGRI